MIRFSCPVCQQHLSARVGGAGEKIACPCCGQRLQIPTPRENRPTPPAGGPAYRPPEDCTPVKYATLAVVTVVGLKILAILAPILILFLILCIRLSILLR